MKDKDKTKKDFLSEHPIGAKQGSWYHSHNRLPIRTREWLRRMRDQNKGKR